jgi:hypothetical protein
MSSHAVGISSVQSVESLSPPESLMANTRVATEFEQILGHGANPPAGRKKNGQSYAQAAENASRNPQHNLDANFLLSAQHAHESPAQA